MEGQNISTWKYLIPPSCTHFPREVFFQLDFFHRHMLFSFRVNFQAMLFQFSVFIYPENILIPLEKIQQMCLPLSEVWLCKSVLVVAALCWGAPLHTPAAGFNTTSIVVWVSHSEGDHEGLIPARETGRTGTVLLSLYPHNTIVCLVSQGIYRHLAHKIRQIA